MACILFVDDDYFTLKTYEKMVVLNGHQALLAGCAEDAFQILSDQQPDLIVVDMRLPDMDGFEFLKRLETKTNLAGIPAVMVSAHTAHYSRDAIAAGAIEYWSKPIDLERLLSLIDEVQDT